MLTYADIYEGGPQALTYVTYADVYVWWRMRKWTLSSKRCKLRVVSGSTLDLNYSRASLFMGKKSKSGFPCKGCCSGACQHLILLAPHLACSCIHIILHLLLYTAYACIHASNIHKCRCWQRQKDVRTQHLVTQKFTQLRWCQFFFCRHALYTSVKYFVFLSPHAALCNGLEYGFRFALLLFDFSYPLPLLLQLLPAYVVVLSLSQHSRAATAAYILLEMWQHLNSLQTLEVSSRHA